MKAMQVKNSDCHDQGSDRRAPLLSPLLRRIMVLAALLVGCAIIYGLVLARFDLSKKGGEIQAGATISEARVSLYLQPI